MSSRQPRGFRRSLTKAEKMLTRKQDLAELLEKAKEKASQKKSALGDALKDLLLLFDLVKHWSTGAYKGLSLKNILIVIGAVIYFLNPFDAIPDFIIGYGFVDDITVIAYVLNSLKQEIDDYRKWLELSDQSSE